MARDGSAWLKRPAPRSEARIKLYCLPHGGGSARAYAAWGDLLPDWIEVVALELPGHGRRRAEPAIDDMGRLVAALVAEIGADIDRPYAIFGHSVGALVAFETARALVASGADAPLRVFLAGYAASSRAAAQPMSGLCDGDLIDALAALGGLGGQAGDGLDAVRADRELAALVLAAVRADFRLAEAHAIEPAARLAVPLTVLGGADDESVCSADLHGWSAHAAAGFQACVLPGGHFFTETSRAALLDILADRLAADVAMLPPSIARGPAEAYPVETCLHALFREAARTFGEATALVGVDRSLSFTALDAESDRLAHHLVRLGCGVDRLVGLFLETSVDYVVAYLAALKAGGAYMPIPLGTPDAAIADILAAAAPVAVVTRSGLSQRLPPDWSEAGRVLELASHGRGGELQATPAPATLDPASQTGPGTGPATGPGPDSLAYCVMTSGTTGAPKGILCPHRGAVNSYWWRYRHLPYGPGEREAANIFFVWEVLRPLLVGVPAYVIPDDTIFDPRRLIAYLERHAITRVLFTPSLFEQVLASAGPDIAQRLAALDIVILNGEVVPASLVATARRLLPHVCIVNDYSISETHDVTTATRADWAKPCLGRTLPVGRVMANVAVYILGEDGRPVPWGCQGEVHVGGASVARGYLGRPEEAAERFLPDPFEERPGASMFRTGDRGRLRQDGQLEVTGRIKFLVKIRGYSVVPAAIEAEIASVDGIAAALVVAVEDEATGRPDYLVAYVAGADGAPGGDAVDRLKTHLARRLPAPAIPRAIVPLDRLPLDARTGKVDRRALPRPAAPPSIAAAARAAQAGARDGALRAAIAAAWQDVLGAPPPASDANFFEHGGHSLKAIELTRALSVNAGVDIAVIDVFNAPTVKALADLVAARGGGRDGSVARNASRQRLSRRDGPLDVAVIGMALRLPGAASPQDLWSLIVEGRSAIRTLTDDELRARGVPDALLSRADYVKAGAHVADVDLFDHAAFGLSAAEATLMDPQQRLFLMCCREALERAGRAGGDHWRTGVWAGAYLPTYLVHHLGARRHLDGADPTLFHLAECGNDKDYIAARAAFHFGCQGPAISVQTSCSTGLVAIAEAARAVADGRCDMALAGAASLTFPQGGFVALDGHVGAASGACRAFDARADGTILGDGVGVVLLKRLSDAMADGDSIHAVIKGAGIGNDGSGKAGFSAPSATGQAAVIAAAIEEAGFAAASIGYVEAHGTGTRLGDPIELAGLADGFARSGGAAAGSVALGSIKPNIGHANIAAGVAGFLKAVLVVREGVVPPLVNLAEENPLLRLSETPFRLPRTAEPWGAPLPRRAGVSSFGIGGTNAHIVIEAPPSRLAQRRDAGAPDGPFVLPLSARTPDQARNLAVSMAQAFDDGVTASIGDIAGTLQHGRAGGAARIAVVAGTQDEAARALRARAGAAITARSGGVAFVVPGHGADPSGSGSALAALSRGAAGRIAELSGQFERLGVNGVADVLMAAGTRVEADVEATQAALFTASVVLAEVLAEVGVSPVAIAGHSLGEYAAAVMVGALDVEDAIALVAARGRGIAAAEPGAMLALAAGPETAEALLADVEGLSLAVINGPLDVVVAGREEAIARAERWAQTCGIAARRLAVARAFHSPAMRGAAELLEAAAATHATRQPSRPLASNLTGRFLDGPTLADGPSCYWARQMLAPVRFAEVVAAVAGLRPALFIEVGCGRMLARAVRSIAGPDVVVLSPLAIPNSRVGDGRGALLAAVAAAFEAGADIDWARLDEGRPFCRVELPTTPFERVRLWPHDDVAHAQEAGDRPPRDAAASERGAAKALFYTPSFARLPEIAGAGSRSILPAAGVVVAGGSQGLRRSVIGALLGQGADVIDIEDDHPARVAAALSARRAGRDWPRLVWVD
ncbi:MAG: AMP-binding protein, partial [Hyphomicrobiaceae bacterium]|nr:AMP-binding protein [Hyphomicrobiaceae bacterium]